MRILLISVLIFISSCNQDYRENSDYNTSGKTTEDPSASQDLDDPYFALIESCNERDGNVIINGKCFPAEVSLNLDGTLALGGIGTKEKAYSVRLNQADDICASSPFITVYNRHGQNNTFLNEKYGEENRGLYLISNHKKDFGMRFLQLVSFYREKVPVATNIFGISLDAQDLTLERIQSYCDDIIQKFTEENSTLQELNPLIITPREEWMYCSFLVPIPVDRKDPQFDNFKIQWRTVEDQIYLYAVSLNSPLSLAEEARL